MYSYICLRGIRNNRYKGILTNYHVQSKYICHHQVLSSFAHKEFCTNQPKYVLTQTYSNGTSSRQHNFCHPDTLFNVRLRYISFTPKLYEKEPLKPSSKVEETVQRLKDKKKDESLQIVGEKKPVVKKTLGQRIWDELVHYYHGFRLLFIDIRVSTGLVWRILNGKSLTRREHNLLVRTVGDLFRIIPFSVFIVVPFLEFTLPIFLKLFPGMLPSTFQTTSELEDKMKKSLKVKIEMAKFLQKTLDEMAVQHNDRNSKSAKEFAEWFQKVRTSGQQVSNEEIMKFSKLFQDEITLDSLSRGQLVALCRVLEVQTLGTNNLLRFQLRMKLRSLKADDKLIQKEGINSLNLYELQQACRSRGMRAYGLPEEKLKQQLEQWLDLSLNQKVPPSLLLLSRALMLPEKIPTEDKLKATISALPEELVTQTKAAIAETEGKIDNKVKYEVLKEEVRKMKEERKERREELKRKAQEAILVDKAPILTSAASEELIDKPDITLDDPLTRKKTEQISTKDLNVLEDAIDNLAKGKKKLILEKEKIEDLKEEMADYQEDLQELKNITSDRLKPAVRETKAAKRLYNRVNSMIKKLDTVVQQLESKEEQLKREMAEGQAPEDEVIRIDELLNCIRELQKVPDESVVKQISNILGKMDDDHDGSIKIEEVLKVIQLIGKENVHLSPKQIDEIIELLDKEEVLEVEDKIEKALLKDMEESAKIKCEKTKDEFICYNYVPPEKTSDPDKTKQAQTTNIPPCSIDKSSDKDKPTQL